MARQAGDRIANQLAGAVVRRSAAPADALDCDARASETFRVPQQVFLTAPSAERDGGGVLEQQQRIGTNPPGAFLRKPALDPQADWIWNHPEGLPNAAVHRRSPSSRKLCV